MKLQLGVFTSYKGILIEDWTSLVQNMQVQDADHGYSFLTGFVPMVMWRAFMWYNRDGTPNVQLQYGAEEVWSGRLEDVQITDSLGQNGIQFTALGYWRAFSDLTYTGMITDTSYANWRNLTTTDYNVSLSSSYTIEKFEADNNNRIYLAPRKGEVFSGGSGQTYTVGAWGYEVPEVPGGPTAAARRRIDRVTFHYKVLLPANWTGQLTARNDTWQGGNNAWTVAGNGALQEGDATINLPAQSGTTYNTRLSFDIWYNGAPAQYTAETGAYYMIITSLRVTTRPSTPIDPQTIAWILYNHVYGVNPSMVAADDANQPVPPRLVQSMGLDVTDALYLDKPHSEILTDLAGIGDTSLRMWEVGVREEQRLYFRPRGSVGAVYFVDVDLQDYAIQRSLENIGNTAYTIYRDQSGRRKASLGSNAPADVYNKVGFYRVAMANTSSTSATYAGQLRDALLNDREDYFPRVVIRPKRVVRADNAQATVPLWRVRNGDTIIVRNLPPGLTNNADRIRAFVVKVATWGQDGVLQVEPYEPTPSLVRQLSGVLPVIGSRLQGG